MPVSLGIALDTSGSMLGEKMAAAEAALNRFVFDLLGDQDEMFLYRFDSRPELVQGWTDNRQAIRKALGVIKPNGGTAIYDTVAEAIPLASAGTRRKKALVIISDGNDTSSRTKVDQVSSLVRQTEVHRLRDWHRCLGRSPPDRSTDRTSAAAAGPGAVSREGAASAGADGRHGRPQSGSPQDRVNPDALRRITDDSGGRTELIVSPRDLDPATASIANELSRQYFIGYSSSAPKDGRWHTIDVEAVAARLAYASERAAASSPTEPCYDSGVLRWTVALGLSIRRQRRRASSRIHHPLRPAGNTQARGSVARVVRRRHSARCGADRTAARGARFAPAANARRCRCSPACSRSSCREARAVAPLA